MNLARHITNCSGSPRPEGRAPRAFTLIEMLVVLGIIGVLAAMTVPSFKSAGKGNATATALRQLQDDLAFARQKAITSRTKVYVVFAPDFNWFLNWYTPAVLFSPVTTNFLFTNQAANSVIGGQLTAYALFSPRQVGDQPGQSTPRYLSEWHSLPDGVHIPMAAFRATNLFHNVPGTSVPVRIPVDDAPGATSMELPYIAFDEQGRLIRLTNSPTITSLTLPIVEGSIMHTKESTGQTNIVVATDAIETSTTVPSGQIVAGIEYLVAGTPGSQVRYPSGSTLYLSGQTFVGTVGNTNYSVPAGTPRVVQLYGVRIDAITGRSRAVRPEIQ